MFDDYNTLTRPERDLQYMVSPYREGTKLDLIFLFMQDGKWHPLEAIVVKVYPAYSRDEETARERRRTASALRTIRQHPDLNVLYTGGRYRLKLYAGYPVPSLSFGEYSQKGACCE